MIIGEIKKGVKYHNIEIDLKGIKGKKDLLYKVSKELHFPEVGENNWDAFNDWMGIVYEPFDKFDAVKITFKNCAGLEEEVKKTFFELLQYSAEDGFVTEGETHRRIQCYYEVLDYEDRLGKIAQKVLENKIYKFFTTKIPELKDSIHGFPVDEYKDFDWAKEQDADFLEMYFLTEAVAYGIEPVIKNVYRIKDDKKLEAIFKVIEKFKNEYGNYDERYSQSLWSMFANTFFTVCQDLDKDIFEYIYPHFSENLKNEYNLWQTDYEKWQEEN